MGIQNAGEFEVTLGDVLLTVDKLLNDAPRNATLQGVKRSLGAIHQACTRKEKMGPMMLQQLANAAEALRQATDDPDLGDKLYDLRDYLEQNPTS